MATSGSFSFTVSMADIINQSALNCRKIGENDSLTAQEYVDSARMLNMMVKQWMGKMDFAPGMKMWTRRHGDLFLSLATGTYNLGPSGDNWTLSSVTTTLNAGIAVGGTTVNCLTAGMNVNDFIGIQISNGDVFWTKIATIPNGTSLTILNALTIKANFGAYVYAYTTKAQRPLTIETAVLRNYDYSDTPLNIMTLQDYDFLPTKQQPVYVSLPSAIYYESQIPNGTLFTDVAGVSDTAYRLHISFLEPIQDFVNPTDNPQFPQQWYLPLCWGLTKQVCAMWGLSFTKDMEDNLAGSMAMAKQADSEITSLYFQPGDW